MTGRPIEADYLVIGSGATGMAFADSLVAESTATLVVVDRHHRPGGHWNDSYPFVRLHQPAARYGVNSWPLGTNAREEVGLNKGDHELASGQEVLTHFEQVMQHRLLPSGRVQYFPMSEADEDGVVTSLMSGRRTVVRAGKVVDAHYFQPEVPSTRTPHYAISPDVTCIPPNDLPHIAPSHSSFVVIGAGKTGMDACLWLLQNGAEPDQIIWVMPRDFWLMNRAAIQSGPEGLTRFAENVANHTQAMAEASSAEDALIRLEALGEVRRIDPARTPSVYHGATVSEAELLRLRSIRHVIRLGRVTKVEDGKMTLDNGTVSVEPGSLYIDCTASAIHTEPLKPIFAPNRITLQWVRQWQPVFSAALIGHVEAVYNDEDEKNRICTPVEVPDTLQNWLRMTFLDLRNRRRWAEIPELLDWLAASRVDFFIRDIRNMDADDTATATELQRYQQFFEPALANLTAMLHDRD